MASRYLVIAMFGSIGFAMGFLAFLASPSISQAFAELIPQIVLDQSVVFATICGAAGAVISTSVVTVWAKRV